jgi:hypothetical protein
MPISTGVINAAELDQFCDDTVNVIKAVSTYAGYKPEDRVPEDDAALSRLLSASSALVAAINSALRMSVPVPPLVIPDGIGGAAHPFQMPPLPRQPAAEPLAAAPPPPSPPPPRPQPRQPAAPRPQPAPRQTPAPAQRPVTPQRQPATR